MGNRAVIKAKGNNSKAVYLHWNGGRDSIEAFLKYCELRGFRSFEDGYGMARFCQVVSNFFGADGLSIGIEDSVESCGDNGVYVVEGWEIVDRIDYNRAEQNSHDLNKMLLEIDEAQPLMQQLSAEYLSAEIVDTSTLNIGDTVFLMDSTGEIKKFEVDGIGIDRFVNGTKVLNIPYVKRFLNDGTYANNINNYITTENVRIASSKVI